MRLHAHLQIQPGERVFLKDRPDLEATIINVGSEWGDVPVHVSGTPAERAAFLREAALQFLVMAVQVEAGTDDPPLAAYEAVQMPGEEVAS